jgi:hypothetical protein
LSKRKKILGILLISLLLGSFVLGVLAEVSPRYINSLSLIVFFVVIPLGIVLYYNRKSKARAVRQNKSKAYYVSARIFL